MYVSNSVWISCTQLASIGQYTEHTPTFGRSSLFTKVIRIHRVRPLHLSNKCDDFLDVRSRDCGNWRHVSVSPVMLLHTCCAPCSIYPLKILRELNIDVMGFFYRHNIHPLQECYKRESALQNYAESIDLKVIYQKGYEIEKFLQSVVFREEDRCRYCYHDRLKATALVAKKGKFDSFSTTLLYSRFQNHQQIKKIVRL